MIASFVFAPRGLRLLGAALATAAVLTIGTACTGSSSSSTSSRDLSGTYEAKDKDGAMSLEFKSGGKVRMSMAETGKPPEPPIEADYMIDGNNVTVQAPGGMAFTLVRSGDKLEGSAMGQILHFNKK
jgi:hypothetical protein